MQPSGRVPLDEGFNDIQLSKFKGIPHQLLRIEGTPSHVLCKIMMKVCLHQFLKIRSHFDVALSSLARE